MEVAYGCLQKRITMSEAKTKQLMVNIEPTIYDLVQKVLTVEGTSASAYLRTLMLADLTHRDLLTEENMRSMLGVPK